jgi:hypothetical protein
MNVENRTCRYCGYRFETEQDRENHIPCPERTADTYGKWDVLPISPEIADPDE